MDSELTRSFLNEFKELSSTIYKMEDKSNLVYSLFRDAKNTCYLETREGRISFIRMICYGEIREQIRSLDLIKNDYFFCWKNYELKVKELDGQQLKNIDIQKELENLSNSLDRTLILCDKISSFVSMAENFDNGPSLSVSNRLERLIIFVFSFFSFTLFRYFIVDTFFGGPCGFKEHCKSSI